MTIPLTAFEYITIERKRQGLTIGELAKKTGLSRNYISLIERGKAHNVRLSTLIKVFDALNCDVTVNLEPKKGAA